MRFMQTESVLQTKNRSGPAKNRFSVALVMDVTLCKHSDTLVPFSCQYHFKMIRHCKKSKRNSCNTGDCR